MRSSYQGKSGAITPYAKFHRQTLNLSHIVVKNGLLAAIIPPNGYASPIPFSDCALIGLIL